MLIRKLCPLDDSLDQVLIKDSTDMVLGSMHIDAFESQDSSDRAIYDKLFRGESVTVAIVEGFDDPLR